MSLEKVRREVADTKREFGQDIQNADTIAESKKRTMSGLESITNIPDAEDMSALEGAKDSVRSDAKSDFADRVDRSIADPSSQAEGTQSEAEGFQSQVNENASEARSIAGSSDYGSSGIGSFADLMTQRGREYGDVVSESQRDVQDARQQADARRRELDS